MGPLELNKTYTVTFPMGGAQEITVTSMDRVRFTGTNAAGKTVTVRSYKMVKGFEDYEPPVPEPRKPATGDEVTVTSGRGTKKVTVTTVGEKTFRDTTGKEWPFARIRWEDEKVP